MQLGNPDLKFKTNCAKCGEPLILYRHRLKYKKSGNFFCGHECHRSWQNGENSATWKGGKIEVECQHCGKLFYRWPKETGKYKRHFCSPECRETGKRTWVKTECTYCGAKITKVKSYLKRYPISFCNRSCRAKWMVQENNPAWRNGAKSEPYCPLWLDTEYKASIRERDGNHCSNPACLKITARLCIHHIDYDKKNCEPSNLITLCNSCNSIANIDRDWHQAWYRRIFNKKFRRNYAHA